MLVAFLGAFRLGLGIVAASGQWGSEALAQYTRASSSGVLIDQGLVAILGAIALGTLAEISFSVRKKADV